MFQLTLVQRSKIHGAAATWTFRLLRQLPARYEAMYRLQVVVGSINTSLDNPGRRTFQRARLWIFEPERRNIRPITPDSLHNKPAQTRQHRAHMLVDIAPFGLVVVAGSSTIRMLPHFSRTVRVTSLMLVRYYLVFLSSGLVFEPEKSVTSVATFTRIRVQDVTDHVV